MSLKSLVVIGVALLPAIASADVFNWTFGGGSDPVSGNGTLTASYVSPNLYIVQGGTGIVTYDGHSYDIDILPLVDTGDNFPAVHYGSYGNVCGGTNADNLPCATLQNPPLSGGANYTFDNALYPNALPANSDLDADGIVLYNAAGPAGQTFFNLWSSAASDNPLPDNFFATDSGNGWNNYNVNLINPFMVSLATAPEPGLYGVLALGLTSLILAVNRRKKT